MVHGGSANTFGSLGALLVPDGFKIPTVMATVENVKHYDLQLIASGDDFAISSDQFQIAMMKYDYTKDYKKDFLMQKYGGGGIFVETHNFPHIHIPLNENCGGYIVIGKQVSERLYHFTAFHIGAYRCQASVFDCSSNKRDEPCTQIAPLLPEGEEENDNGHRLI